MLASRVYLNYSPNGHVLTPDGQLFVSTLGFSDMGVPARIVSVDLATGDQAVVAEGGSLGYPGALAVYQTSNRPSSRQLAYIACSNSAWSIGATDPYSFDPTGHHAGREPGLIQLLLPALSG